MPTLLRGKPRHSYLESANYKDQLYQLVQGVLHNKGDLKDYIKKRTRNYLLVNNNGSTVLGFATMKNKAGINRLDLIGTLPGRGYGKIIMNAIRADAKKKRIPAVNILNAVGPARPFYRKQGYSLKLSPDSTYHGVVMRRAISKRSPSVSVETSHRSNSVKTVKKRKRTPSVSPTSKKRATPKSPLSARQNTP